MRVLVTGGAGYIGTPLCVRLSQLGHEVVCWDPGFFGYHFGETPAGLRLVPKRVQALCAEDFQQLRPDWVLHLSGLSNDPMADFAPRMNWAENMRATEHVGALAEAAGAALVFASSASVYGFNPELLLDEDAPVSPIGFYSESKAAAERWLLARHSRCYVLRQATVMGRSPRMRFDLLTNGMTLTAWTRRQIQILYGGREARPQIHVEDLVDAYVAILNRDALAPGVYNVGATNDNVAELASVIRERMKSEHARDVELVVSDEPRKHRSYRLSWSKLAEASGWTPRRTVADAVDEICVGLGDASLSSSDPRTSNIRWMKLLAEAGVILARTGPVLAEDDEPSALE